MSKSPSLALADVIPCGALPVLASAAHASPKLTDAVVRAQPAAGKELGIGREATTAEIAGWDIEIRPDGQGLPAGKGTVKQGEPFCAERWASRHGEFGAAQALTDGGLYSIMADRLHLIDMVTSENFELDDKKFRTIKLPNEPNFFDDNREVAEKGFWPKIPCLSNCVPSEAKVTGRAGGIDVTPEPGKGPKLE